MAENRTKSDAYMLRLPDGMRDELKTAAGANHRSMNDEIVARLSGSRRTLRDWFAGQALLALTSVNTIQDRNSLSAAAYEVADAMLAARDRSAS